MHTRKTFHGMRVYMHALVTMCVSEKMDVFRMSSKSMCVFFLINFVLHNYAQPCEGLCTNTTKIIWVLKAAE
jgi:hypothetical protein